MGGQRAWPDCLQFCVVFEDFEESFLIQAVVLASSPLPISVCLGQPFATSLQWIGNAKGTFQVASISDLVAEAFRFAKPPVRPNALEDFELSALPQP